MSPGIPTKVISASLGLAAFATAVVVGLWVDNPADTILVRAVVSMFLAQCVGMALGATAERAVQDHINAQQHRQSAPSAQVTTDGAVHTA